MSLDRKRKQRAGTEISLHTTAQRSTGKRKHEAMTEIRLEITDDTRLSDITDFAMLAKRYGRSTATVLQWEDKDTPVLAFVPQSGQVDPKARHNVPRTAMHSSLRKYG